MDKFFLLTLVNSALDEKRSQRMALMTDDNKSSGSKAVLLSNNRRETAILRLFKYIISKLPDSFTITDDELIYSVECLCVTRPWARKAKTKTEGDK